MRSLDVRFGRYGMHAFRVALFATIILLIHWRHERQASQSRPAAPLDLDRVAMFLPEVATLSDADARGIADVRGQSGQRLGYAIQTSPQSDHLIGFSGPTNVLIVFAADDTIRGIDILSSDDTRDHVRQVLADERFLTSLNGLTWNEAAVATGVDSVSGATLTSLAIREAIARRLGGGQQSLRFSDPVDLGTVKLLFPNAASMTADAEQPTLLGVLNERGSQIGAVLRTSPYADNITGYQGPTEALIGFDQSDRVVGIVCGHSYDNEPYVGYVREDDYFAEVFNGLSMEELSALDLGKAEIEGVSGATMTSMAMAEGAVAAAAAAVDAAESPDSGRADRVITPHDIGTALVIVVGVAIGMTTLRANKPLRIAFQLALIGYLGLTAGNLLSQAMLVGWAKHGVPWQSAVGLVMLSVAALTLPIATRRNLYCTHLCPHGAAQQLLKNRLGRTVRLGPAVRTALALLPALLLAWCLIVGMTTLGFSLVDIEPFDAYVFRIAGGATIAVAVVGLVASLFLPMAYCRYGCPTGAVLEFLRLNARSDRWTIRDTVAVGYLLLAIGLAIS